MTVDRIVHLVAGLMVLFGLGMAHYVYQTWLLLPAFVGSNLAQSGLLNSAHWRRYSRRPACRTVAAVPDDDCPDGGMS